MFCALHNQLASPYRHAHLTRCFSAVAELLVQTFIFIYFILSSCIPSTFCLHFMNELMSQSRKERTNEGTLSLMHFNWQWYVLLHFSSFHFFYFSRFYRASAIFVPRYLPKRGFYVVVVVVVTVRHYLSNIIYQPTIGVIVVNKCNDVGL